MSFRNDPIQFKDAAQTMAPFRSFTGHAAVIPLDYGMGSIDRMEHSIIIQPDHWASMVDLLFAPQAYVNHVRKHYTGDGAALEWKLRNPLTVSIEPLTIATPGTIKTLKFLSRKLVTKLRSCVLSELNSMSPDEFRSSVMTSFGAGQANKSFQGFFLAEFAANTSALIIRYLPPDEPDEVFQGNITPMTINRIDQLGVASTGEWDAFLHLDIDLPTDNSKRSHVEVSRRRAEFVVDYISNPVAFLEKFVKLSNGRIVFDDPSTQTRRPAVTLQEALKETSGTLETSGSALPMTMPSVVSTYSFNTGVPRFEPTVVVEGIRPDIVPPAFHSENADPTLQSDGEPAPFICVVLTIVVNGVNYYVIDQGSTLVKGYVAPQLPGGPPPERRGDSVNGLNINRKRTGDKVTHKTRP